jgi:cardiolipin synthase A/B
MSPISAQPIIAEDIQAQRSLLDQAFFRAAGAHTIAGNRVRLLRDAAENYPAWLDAIASAERYVHFESYIIRDDKSGRKCADALIAKARQGVSVRLLYDWMGAVGKTPARFWADLRRGGVEVRCFNPLRLSSPLGWVHRDHRKSLVVDRRVGFVTGLCVGDPWVGYPERGIDPWRDTGVEVVGPAVVELEHAFARVWAAAGPPLPDQRAGGESDRPGPQGDVSLRVVASEPVRGNLLRVDQLVAAVARETLWLSDAYFAGLPNFVQALRAAALDGVDVRLLVPGGTDIPILRPLSRAGYRPLLDAGVRVFEWNGPMIHAKTAVADGRWARVGSTNLNIASWIGNYELDVVIEDRPFARLMMEQYERDLGNATEVHLHQTREMRRARPTTRGAGSAGRATAGAVRLGNTFSAAVGGHRVVAPAEARIVGLIGAVLLALAVVAILWPQVLAWPLAALLAWIGGALVARAWPLHRAGRKRRDQREAEDRPNV